MKPLYEKPMWTADAQGYGTTSVFFATLAFIMGAIGIITAVILFFVGLSDIGDGGFTGIVGSIVLGMQSLMLIVFGSMMRLQSKVLLAVFEMSLGETRQQINQADAQADANTDADDPI